MKRCPRCQTTKPLGEFHRDKRRASGHSSWCKDCVSEKNRAKYAAQRSGSVREYERGMSPGQVRQKRREGWREKRMRDFAKRHDGPEERARMMIAQDGRCYLCRRQFESDDDIHVDHDHDCCPTGQRTDSCRACRRGLAHAACNQIIGLCGEDMDRLRTIIASFEPARDAAKARVAALKAAQPQLMPDLDMPLLTPWPQPDGLF